LDDAVNNGGDEAGQENGDLVGEEERAINVNNASLIKYFSAY
jgi:hypothetical protein